MSLRDIFREIEAERVRQDARYTPEHDDNLTAAEWTCIVVRWAAAASNCARIGRMDLFRHRMGQVAAIAVAAMESQDRQNSFIANSAVGQGDVPPAMPEPPVAPVCLSAVG